MKLIKADSDSDWKITEASQASGSGILMRMPPAYSTLGQVSEELTLPSQAILLCVECR